MVEIIDCESVYDINLYYTSDKMSYPESVLSPKIEIPKNKIEDLLMCFKPTELQPMSYEEYKKSISTSKNQFTSWLKKILTYFKKK
jgi:hypothetical protein